MDESFPAHEQLLAENQTLRLRLEEAEELIRAIRRGAVDAFVIDATEGPQIYVLQGLEAEASRLRGEMLAHVSDAVIVQDNEGRVVYLNLAAERLYGVVASDALGRELSTIYRARWLAADDEAMMRAALGERGEWRGENIHVARDGRELHVESGITMLRRDDPEATRSLAVIHDITERKRQEKALRISETRYRRLFEAAHDGVLILDPRSRKIIDANPFMTQLLGYSHDELMGKEVYEIGLLKDQSASREMFQVLQRASELRYEELPLETRGGRHRDVEVAANIYDEGGRAVVQCNIRDITERKRAEEHVKLLMAEVNHRAKNLLAVVQVVAQQTARHGDPTTFAARLSERISGLAAGQDLLVESEWQGIDVGELVAAQLAHFKDLFGTRVLLDGPPARLSMAAAQGIGMALHELATNAAKHGALSNSNGQVHIAWQVTEAPESVFSMSWLEDGGPRLAGSPGKGFGQLVIGRMAEEAVQGKAQITFREQGLAWGLSTQAANALASSPQGGRL